MLAKNLQSQNGNFLVIVSFIATSFVLFFSLFSAIAKTYLVDQQDAQNSAQALYAAEGVMERMSFEYNQNNPLTPATTIFYEEENICKNFSFDIFDANVSQSVIDFGANCKDDEEQIVEIGKGDSRIVKYASRMVEKEEAYLDRFQLFEYRLTRNEFLESLEGATYKKPEKLQISWKTDAHEAQKTTAIEFILASWESLPNNEISSNIQVQRIIPKPEQVVFDADSGVTSYELFDLSAENENSPLFCNENCDDFFEKEYILFVKSFQLPLHIEIQGFESVSDSMSSIKSDIEDLIADKKEAELQDNLDTAKDLEKEIFIKQFKIPSRFIFFESTAIIENEQDSLKNYERKIKSQKQIYRNFDSNFPYARYEIL